MSSPASKTDLRRARGGETRRQILTAAREALAANGTAGTTTRAIADRAGVRVSLVHYHFGGKQQLLAAVLDDENERLLERQRALFAGPEPLAQKWRKACAYLLEDLSSGYVRILWELWSQVLADDELAARWRQATAGWRDLLTHVAQEWTSEYDLKLPISPRALATLVGDAFLGAEAEILAGVNEDEAPHHEALTSVISLIEWAENRSPTLTTTIEPRTF
jgi:AcrR family transcriptional regulator